MKGAQMRIERKDQKSALITTTTDAKGHYAANKLPVGIYRVSVVGADGTVKSGTHIRTTASSVKVDFDLKPRARKINHFVWMRPETGSHMAGRWVPVDEYGTPVAGTFNSQTASGELARDMTRRQRNGSPY